MRLSCLFNRHEAGAVSARNQGLDFSRCAHCRRDLVRSRRRWQAVPRGFRVVWRSSAGEDRTAAPLPAPIVRRPARARMKAPMAGPSLLASLAVAGLRVLAWKIGDGVGRLARLRIARRPARLRLTAS